MNITVHLKQKQDHLESTLYPSLWISTQFIYQYVLDWIVGTAGYICEPSRQNPSVLWVFLLVGEPNSKEVSMSNMPSGGKWHEAKESLEGGLECGTAVLREGSAEKVMPSIFLSNLDVEDVEELCGLGGSVYWAEGIAEVLRGGMTSSFQELPRGVRRAWSGVEGEAEGPRAQSRGGLKRMRSSVLSRGMTWCDKLSQHHSCWWDGSWRAGVQKWMFLRVSGWHWAANLRPCWVKMQFRKVWRRFRYPLPNLLHSQLKNIYTIVIWF